MKPWTSCFITLDPVLSSVATRHGIRKTSKYFFCFDLLFSIRVNGEGDNAEDKLGASKGSGTSKCTKKNMHPRKRPTSHLKQNTPTSLTSICLISLLLRTQLLEKAIPLPTHSSTHPPLHWNHSFQGYSDLLADKFNGLIFNASCLTSWQHLVLLTSSPSCNPPFPWLLWLHFLLVSYCSGLSSALVPLPLFTPEALVLTVVLSQPFSLPSTFSAWEISSTSLALVAFCVLVTPKSVSSAHVTLLSSRTIYITNFWIFPQAASLSLSNSTLPKQNSSLLPLTGSSPVSPRVWVSVFY